jgi:hypothetical protein
MIISVIGCDPGPTTGLCFLDYVPYNGVYALPQVSGLIQVDSANAVLILQAMLQTWYADESKVQKRFASVEAFVTGRSAGTKGPQADVTRQLVMQLSECLQMYGYAAKIRKAADVKPWATDKRLQRAGIAPVKSVTGQSGTSGKLKDAYDAARQALFSARWDANMKDPLA